MPKYIISWNAGYGDSHEVVDVPTLEDAEMAAYEQWREEAESHATYEAEEYSEEKAADCGL